MTLSCGHEPSPHSAHTTGTAKLPDGREVCWECADTFQREAMRTSVQVMAYLSGDGTAITTWSGGKLADVVCKNTRRVGFHRSTRVYFNAVDTAGKRWHGTSPGPGMYARLRASKR